MTIKAERITRLRGFFDEYTSSLIKAKDVFRDKRMFALTTAPSENAAASMFVIPYHKDSGGPAGSYRPKIPPRVRSSSSRTVAPFTIKSPLKVSWTSAEHTRAKRFRSISSTRHPQIRPRSPFFNNQSSGPFQQ